MLKDFLKKLDFRGKEIKVFEHYRTWFFLPLILLFVCLALGTFYQISPRYSAFANIGIDFQGGTVLNVEMHGADMNKANYEKNLGYIHEILADNGLTPSVDQKSGDYAIIVRYTNVVGGEDMNTNEKTAQMNNINGKVRDQVVARFEQEYSGAEVKATSSLTGATASDRLIKTAVLSVVITIVAILIYIAIRFDLFSGIATIVALMYDLILMTALTIAFRLQINSSFIACLITIVGYAINNCIIIFDRIRDNLAPYKASKKKMVPREIINESVTATFTRSLYTTITTLITLVLLAILGVSAIKEFAFPIIFGLLIGLFTSTFIAPSIWGVLQVQKADNFRKWKDIITFKFLKKAKTAKARS